MNFSAATVVALLYVFIAAAWYDNGKKKIGNIFKYDAMFNHFLKLMDL